MVKVKYIGHASEHFASGASPFVEFDGCRFIYDPQCRDYDWLLVYDDFPRQSVGSIVNECESLACPRENTILVTAEPPTIKIYPYCYTNQFGYVLTTHAKRYLPHPGWRVGEGCLLWMAGYPPQEVYSMPEYTKTKLISTVCSAKQQRMTLHHARFAFTRHLQDALPEMDWYGFGVRDLPVKSAALSPYRYHVAVENYIADHHWTDKISDPLLGLCLTFYAGDPKLGEILPPESFIPVPLGDPEKAAAIIREAIANNEYEKRLPAIREARRLIVTKYNIFNRVAALIKEVEAGRSVQPEYEPFTLKGRHHLRHNPLCLADEWVEYAWHRLGFLINPPKY